MKLGWIDVCYLGYKSFVTNVIGDSVESLVYSDEYIFCKQKSVTRAEYYNATIAKMKPAIILVVKTADYESQRFVMYDNQEYTVIRTYQAGSEEIELTLEAGIHDD